MERAATVGFYKVDESLAINKDNVGLKAYKMKKMKDREIGQIQMELTELKSDVNEIKQILRSLVR